MHTPAVVEIRIKLVIVVICPCILFDESQGKYATDLKEAVTKHSHMVLQSTIETNTVL